MADAPNKVAAGSQQGPTEGMEPVRFTIPAVWKAELQAAARAQSIDLSDLMRIVTRGFLRERYDEATQRRLGLL